MVRSTTHAAAVLNGQDSESDGDTGKGREEKEVASLLDRLTEPNSNGHRTIEEDQE